MLLQCWSESQHTVFVVALTVPLEVSVEEAYVCLKLQLRGKKRVCKGRLCPWLKVPGTVNFPVEPLCGVVGVIQ